MTRNHIILHVFIPQVIIYMSKAVSLSFANHDSPLCRKTTTMVQFKYQTVFSQLPHQMTKQKICCQVVRYTHTHIYIDIIHKKTSCHVELIQIYVNFALKLYVNAENTKQTLLDHASECHCTVV